MKREKLVKVKEGVSEQISTKKQHLQVSFVLHSLLHVIFS